MSHYTGHHQQVQVPRARVAFFGGSLVGVGLFGFYAFLHQKHERKHRLDQNSDDQARISSWEARMLRRANPVPSSNSPEVLRASRIEARSTPLTAPKSTHDARHRTLSEDPSFSTTGTRDFSQPTAQKGHSDGRAGVYTKNPGWREATHFASGMKTAGTGVGDREAQLVEEVVVKAKEGVETVAESVKSAFGK